MPGFRRWDCCFAHWMKQGWRERASGLSLSLTRTKTTSTAWWPPTGQTRSPTSTGFLFRKKRFRCSTRMIDSQGFGGSVCRSENGAQIGRGITAIEAHGHEVGHTVFAVTSGGENSVGLGRHRTCAVDPVRESGDSWELDADQSQARHARQRMLRLAAQPDFFIAGAHLDFPGVGRVAESGGAFRYAPL